MDTLTLNQANLITFVMVDTGGIEVAGLGTTFTVQVAKNTGAFAASAGTKAEISNGWYGYTLTASECDTVGALSVKVTGTGAVQQNLSYFVGGANAGAVPFTYTLTSTEGGLPLTGASVWVSTDVDGVRVIARGTTDVLGKVTFYVQVGTYYVWRELVGYQFSNPDTETVA